MSSLRPGLTHLDITIICHYEDIHAFRTVHVKVQRALEVEECVMGGSVQPTGHNQDQSRQIALSRNCTSAKYLAPLLLAGSTSPTENGGDSSLNSMSLITVQYIYISIMHGVVLVSDHPVREHLLRCPSTSHFYAPRSSVRAQVVPPVDFIRIRWHMLDGEGDISPYLMLVDVPTRAGGGAVVM